jgi:hypothetical protein
MFKDITMKKNINYINLNTGEQLDNIWDYLNTDGWKNVHPTNFEYNNLIGVLKRKDAKPVVADFLPIYKGMQWLDKDKKAIDPTYVPKIFDANMDSFLTAAHLFFKQYENKKIGVQLSGGLDSSIIIGLLKYFKIPFYLVGLTSKRYEFRTEVYVQNILSEWAIESVLINYEDYLPLSNLHEVPKHQYPDLLVNNYSSNKAMALECKRMGIDILLTGEGGDNVFVEPIPYDPKQCSWIPQSFGDTWLAEYVYTPFDVNIIPFYEDKGVLDAIYNLRIGQGEDNLKLWTRKFFKEFLPQELVNFTYCADFWGVYISGLQKAIPQIKILCDRAFDLTQNLYFSKESINNLLRQDLLSAKKEVYQKIEARAALAVWINSLNK